MLKLVYSLLIPALPPSLDLHCNSYNQTFSSFTVSCTSTHQLGLSYLFVIKNKETEAVVTNVSTSSPSLTVQDLPASTDFLVRVDSYSGGARSHSVSLTTFTTRAGEKPLATMPERAESSQAVGLFPLLALFLLISLVLVLLIISVTAAVRRRVLQAGNSPSGQLELLSQKPDSDPHLSPDLIPKESGNRLSVDRNDVAPPLVPLVSIIMTILNSGSYSTTLVNLVTLNTNFILWRNTETVWNCGDSWVEIQFL